MNTDGDLSMERSGKRWRYFLSGRWCGDFGTKPEAARAFVKAYLEQNPKYKPLAEGKTWRQLFAMLNVAA